MHLDRLRRLLDVCGCGHPRHLHEHYRRGTDCSAPDCACRRYQRAVLNLAVPRPRPWGDELR
jgi:hypothetical protein